MADYGALADHLAARDGPRVTLTFGEVEAIVGEVLPLAGRLRLGWWGRHPTHHHHDEPWLRIGWRVDGVDAYAATITFARAGAAEG